MKKSILGFLIFCFCPLANAQDDRVALEDELRWSILVLENMEMECEWTGTTVGDFVAPTRIVIDSIDQETRELGFHLVADREEDVESYIYVAHHKVDFEVPRLEKVTTRSQKEEVAVIDYTYTGCFFDNLSITKRTDLADYTRTMTFEYRKTFKDGGAISSVICGPIAR
ncbi:MAG: hypothetical protein AB7T49_04140 [Oligoflexales bacterium]